MITVTHRVEGLEDRILVQRRPRSTIIAVVDGAGNGGQGGRAADIAIDHIAHCDGFVDWYATLLKVDQILLASGHGGEATCVGIEVSDAGEIRGASVGDSGAVMFARSTPPRYLTEHQDRARLGSGRASPVRFKAQLLSQLVVATDGLLKYCRADILKSCAPRGVDALVESVRLKSGTFQDDVAVVLIE